MRSKESLAAEEFAKAHAEYVKAVLRNPEYLRQCENEKRADARKFRPPPPTEVPDNLRMPAWWYMIYFYKIHECNCESKHTVHFSLTALPPTPHPPPPCHPRPPWGD
jgi:hypothetical protein